MDTVLRTLPNAIPPFATSDNAHCPPPPTNIGNDVNSVTHLMMAKATSDKDNPRIGPQYQSPRGGQIVPGKALPDNLPKSN